MILKRTFKFTDFEKHYYEVIFKISLYWQAISYIESFCCQ